MEGMRGGMMVMMTNDSGHTLGQPGDQDSTLLLLHLSSSLHLVPPRSLAAPTVVSDIKLEQPERLPAEPFTGSTRQPPDSAESRLLQHVRSRPDLDKSVLSVQGSCPIFEMKPLKFCRLLKPVPLVP